MGFYRKRPAVIEAHQWFKNGDHPQDNCQELIDQNDVTFLGEGKVVRYYRTPELDGKSICIQCSKIMHIHGWIDTPEGGHTVCPGDFVITSAEGERYPCKPENFAKIYESCEKPM